MIRSIFNASHNCWWIIMILKEEGWWKAMDETVQWSSKLKHTETWTAIIFRGWRETSASANTMSNPLWPEALRSTVCTKVSSDISVGNSEVFQLCISTLQAYKKLCNNVVAGLYCFPHICLYSFFHYFVVSLQSVSSKLYAFCFVCSDPTNGEGGVGHSMWKDLVLGYMFSLDVKKVLQTRILAHEIVRHCQMQI